MNLGKNIMMIVSLMVAVILALAVLVPVIQDTSASEDTLTNEGYFRLSSIESTSDDTITFMWDHTKPNMANINGTDIEINYPAVDVISISLVFSDTFTIRFYKEYGAYSCQAYLPFSAFVGASVANGTDLTATATGGTISVANTAATPATGSATYDTLYYPDTNGSWIMKDKDKPAYVFPDSTIIVANGLTAVGERVVGLYFEGNIEDGYDFTIYRSNATESNVTSVYSEVNEYKDIVALDKITFTLTTTDDSVDATYSYFLVPYEVTAERSVHVTPIEASLLGIIPLLVVIGIVIGAVWFIRQKN